MPRPRCPTPSDRLSRRRAPLSSVSAPCFLASSQCVSRGIMNICLCLCSYDGCRRQCGEHGDAERARQSAHLLPAGAGAGDHCGLPDESSQGLLPGVLPVSRLHCHCHYTGILLCAYFTSLLSVCPCYCCIPQFKCSAREGGRERSAAPAQPPAPQRQQHGAQHHLRGQPRARQDPAGQGHGQQGA